MKIVLYVYISDVDDIKYVINYDYSNNSEDYVHRIGRTGRREKKVRNWSQFLNYQLNARGLRACWYISKFCFEGYSVHVFHSWKFGKSERFDKSASRSQSACPWWVNFDGAEYILNVKPISVKILCYWFYALYSLVCSENFIFNLYLSDMEVVWKETLVATVAIPASSLNADVLKIGGKDGHGNSIYLEIIFNLYLFYKKIHVK